jgi:hypothetical protein
VGLPDLALADLSAKVDCPKIAEVEKYRFAIDNKSSTGQLRSEYSCVGVTQATLRIGQLHVDDRVEVHECPDGLRNLLVFDRLLCTCTSA